MKEIVIQGLEATDPGVTGSPFVSQIAASPAAHLVPVEPRRSLSGPVTLDPRFVAGLQELTGWTRRDRIIGDDGSEQAHLLEGLEVLRRLSALTSEIVGEQTAVLESATEASLPNLADWKAQLARYSGTSAQLAGLFDRITARLTRSSVSAAASAPAGVRC
jgi:hypothetical protein